MSCEECEKIQEQNLQGENIASIRVSSASVRIGACDKHFREIQTALGYREKGHDSPVFRINKDVDDSDLINPYGVEWHKKVSNQSCTQCDIVCTPKYILAIYGHADPFRFCDDNCLLKFAFDRHWNKLKEDL